MANYYLRNILLIDDDEDDIGFFESALTVVSPHSKLSTAINCNTALHLINNKHFEIPDVIFLDLQLPVIDGFTCIDLLKQCLLLPDVPIVVLSGTVPEEKLDRLYDAGVSYFISKPPTTMELQRLVSKMVNTPLVFDYRTKTNFFVNRPQV